MRRYKQGMERQQGLLMPARVDEYVAQDNPVRTIDVYGDSLDMEAMGIQHATGGVTAGQPAYPPRAMLKLYLYGYLHRVRSSRQLEQEAQRNLEVIWLLEGLRPGYKTIADFRKDNLDGLRAVNKDFVALCKELDLFGRELVAIDGSFFRGNVSKGSIYTEERLKKSLERIEQHITEYLHSIEQADQEEAGQGMEQTELQEKLQMLKERQVKHQVRLKKLQESGDKQLAEVDEDARWLTKNGQCVAGYNVQTGVDDKHKLLVTCEVTQDGNDENQLEGMSKAAKAELEVEQLDATADAGYFNVQAIKNCVEANITPYVPEPNKTIQATLQGRFVREDFSYHAEANRFICPAGKALEYKSTLKKDGKTIYQYTSRAAMCAQCPLRKRCLPPKTPYRQVTRWEHEAVIEAHRERMASKGSAMLCKRAALVEHPFGTLKVWCGWRHFLLRGLAKVRAELNLLMLCYNFKRVLNILDLDMLRIYCLQRA